MADEPSKQREPNPLRLAVNKLNRLKAKRAKVDELDEEIRQVEHEIANLLGFSMNDE